MLFFIDETKQTVAGSDVGAIGAVAIPAAKYNRFCRMVYRIKQEELGAAELEQKEIKGNVNFAKSAFKRASIEGSSPSLRAVERMVEAMLDHEVNIIALHTAEPGLLNLRVSDKTRLTDPYVQVIERCAAVMKAHKDKRGLLFFDQMGFKEDARAGCAVQNFFTRTPAKYLADKLFLQVPHFTHSSLSPGLQAADLVAYLAAHQVDGFGTRPELKEWWERFTDLAFYYERRGVVRSSVEAFAERRRTQRDTAAAEGEIGAARGIQNKK